MGSGASPVAAVVASGAAVAAGTGSGVAGAAASLAGLSFSAPSSRTLPVLSKSLVLCCLGGLGGGCPASSAGAALAAGRRAVGGLAVTGLARASG